MPYSLPGHLWPPQRRGVELTIDALLRNKSVCLYSPTGGGKTQQAITLMEWVASESLKGIFYVNRKLLVKQTAERFEAAGLHYGVRAADYEDYYDPAAPFQIASIDTERSRVFGENKQWDLHDANLVVVDEAHIQKSETMRQAVREYRDRGAMVVGLTATPIGLAGDYDELVVSGKLKEYRDCNALVPAIVKSIEQPDLSKIKRSATGEYVMDGKKRKIYTQTIVGNVIDRWKRYNPDARPTMLYAPGKDESVWLTEQFCNAGVNWCHVDATDAVVDGVRATLNRSLWNEILERYKAGDIKGLSSRFKLREGIDVPGTYHCILATPIGSLASYIQTVGRVLRYSTDTPDSVLVTDHGGNYLRHGSPNHDRDWQSWWGLSESVISEMQTNNIRDERIPEPLRCPKCEGERAGGRKCPHCGFEHEKSKRQVLMEDGRMVEHDGHLIKVRKTTMRPNTEELWRKLYFGYSKKKVDQSFAQMAAYFNHTHHYDPPRNLPLMPKNADDWYRKVHAVDKRDLHDRRSAAEAQR